MAAAVSTHAGGFRDQTWLKRLVNQVEQVERWAARAATARDFPMPGPPASSAPWPWAGDVRELASARTVHACLLPTNGESACYGPGGTMLSMLHPGG